MKKSISILLSFICITGLVGYSSKKTEALTSSLTTPVAKAQNINKDILNPLNATYKIENDLIKLKIGRASCRERVS